MSHLSDRMADSAPVPVRFSSLAEWEAAMKPAADSLGVAVREAFPIPAYLLAQDFQGGSPQQTKTS